MSINDLLKKALLSAFFCAFLFSSAPSAFATPRHVCDTQKYDETAQLKYVHDGDTIRLTDNRKIRLLGIDTPELARKGKPAQPFAFKAKKALKKLLAGNNATVNLVYGKEEKDRYGRALAHLFLDNGINIQASLIAQGLAIAHTTPPNTQFSNCYSTIEEMAKKNNLGIWAHEKYQPQPATSISSDDKGFSIITGRVTNLSITSKNIWISLENNLNIQIRGKDRSYFDTTRLACLLGKPIQVRGWLHPKDKGSYMSLRHPTALQLLNRNSCK